MIKKITCLFYGLLLIAGGAIGLAQTQGYLTKVDPQVWLGVYAAISLVALALYLLNGVRYWALLFPAGIFGGLTVLLALVLGGVDHPAITTPLFIGLALPFVVAFHLERQKNWWALIPAGGMLLMGSLMLMIESIPGEWIGSAVLFYLALVFTIVYLLRRAAWAAIVAYVMFCTAFTPLMAMGPRPELTGGLLLCALALPFLFIYLRSPQTRYWALIPFGVLITIALTATYVLLPGLPGPAYDERLATAGLYLGISITFAVLWLRHHKRWAMFVAFAALLLAGLNSLIGDWPQIWPVVAVIAGLYLIYNGLKLRLV